MTSPRTAKRLNRILAMLPWVIANPGASVDEVCERFGYTRPQLAADLDLVFVCGLPGYGPGDLMVAYIDEDEVVVELADYFANPVRLTPPEALSLLAAGMALLSTGQFPGALKTAVAKLQKAVLDVDEETVVVDLAEPEFVAELRGAAASQQVVEIEHTALATGETTTRSLEPWLVFATLGNWYLRGHCRLAGAERVFRIDRIRQVTVQDERFKSPETPPTAEVGYTPGEEDVRAVIRLGLDARWVADYYPVEIVSESADALTVRFSASDASVIAGLLLRLGRSAELVEGDAVRTKLEELRRRILDRYQ
ncbi:MAG: WYL domain-containing protein [Acidimicrobiia bacterium]|nr:WYL domain-containing protein [Acidimicrobiia bacterium]